MSKRVAVLLLLIAALALLLSACSAYSMPAGITPVPTLAPTAPLTPIQAVPGQENSTATAGTPTPGTPAAGTPTP